MTAGSASVSADGSGNITISGTGFAKAYADNANPGIAPATILALKAAINDAAKFQAALDAIYVQTANQLAFLITYIKTNAVVSGSSVT